MAGTVTSAALDVSFNWLYQESLDLSTSSNAGARSLQALFSTGTGSGQANVVYAAKGTINSSSSVTVDLQSLTDFFGDASSFSKIKALYVELTTETSASSILVGAGGVQTPSAPSLSLSVGAGSLAAGDYDVCYSYTNSLGETLVGPVSTITAALNDRIVVGAETLPTGATGRKFYMSLVVNANALALHGSGTGSAYNIDSVPTTTAATIPFSGTASTAVSSLFGGSSHQVRVRNGCCVAVSCPTDTTAYVVSSTAKDLRILNEDSTYTARYVLYVVGTSS